MLAAFATAPVPPMSKALPFSSDSESLIAALADITRRAGAAILEIYGTEFEVQTKSDRSPLTEADLAAHDVIATALRALTPNIPLLSEESTPPPYADRRRWQRYWLVDPLDGTREFVNRNGEFTVNMALIENGQPSLGLVGVPTQGKVYVGHVAARRAECHDGGTVRQLGGRPMAEGRPLTVLASRSHGNERLEQYLQALAKMFSRIERRSVGSSLKLCLLAEGGADLYPRLGPTSEWDIAAAHAVLAAAGGAIWRLDGESVAYNKPSFLNPDFIAVADAGFPWAEQLKPLSGNSPQRQAPADASVRDQSNIPDR